MYVHYPDSGAQVAPGDSIAIDLEGGYGSSVRWEYRPPGSMVHVPKGNIDIELTRVRPTSVWRTRVWCCKCADLQSPHYCMYRFTWIACQDPQGPH